MSRLNVSERMFDRFFFLEIRFGTDDIKCKNFTPIRHKRFESKSRHPRPKTSTFCLIELGTIGRLRLESELEPSSRLNQQPTILLAILTSQLIVTKLLPKNIQHLQRNLELEIFQLFKRYISFVIVTSQIGSMYPQTIVNTFTNLILAATLLSCILSSLTNACPPKGNPQLSTPRPGDRGFGTFRFRREIGVGEEDDKTLISTPASIMMDELVRVLEQEIDVDEVSVIEWTLEGHSVSDFWKLLNIYDKDGNDRISRSEIVQVQNELSKVRV
ncbi:uncharacterized protein LOC105443105 isoform X1 [Strongylocentrotus purpuratus]|uniref:EF-hand domain-containing protein n=2 Tax=Strongylocentrotus purpuratus TaxID=7668 RepID=A0A7M7PJV9_STRPU|nr:uncharacterized protein LOC105443105 isoform X1 [Strongylocentrotus purpuratus]